MSGRTLLVTGGTGSFGHAVVSRFLDTDIGEIRIFSRDEKKQDDMRKQYNNPRLRFYLGTVRDEKSVANAMHDVDFVFHAAALKQVPSCEFFPIEAVYTNVLGTENVLSAAIAAGVQKVVCLSTDKAAYPVNAMGISKAMMEKVFIAKARMTGPDKTMICGVRYGNVIYSRGSVIPLFVEQIRKGGPITITDPQMTRFLMSLDEAVDLVLHAFAHAHSGDLMVQKAPSCYIGDLAQSLLDLFEAGNPIEFIGTRHGEKTYEVLLTREEAEKAEDMGNFFRIPCDDRDLNYALYFEEGSHALTKAVEYNSENTHVMSQDELRQKLAAVKEIARELAIWRQG